MWIFVICKKHVYYIWKTIIENCDQKRSTELQKQQNNLQGNKITDAVAKSHDDEIVKLLKKKLFLL